jgi:copper(I)-binding protein
MSRIRAIIFATLASVALAAPALAHGFKIGDLEIGHPWSRATPNAAKIGGGYLTVKNTGKDADRLVSATVSNADHVEIHEMTMDNGVMKMRPLEKGIEIKPGETVTFAPGGYHLMFMDLKEPLKEGALVKGQLTFEKAGKVDVEFKVESIGYTGEKSGGAKDGAMGGMTMDHKH